MKHPLHEKAFQYGNATNADLFRGTWAKGHVFSFVLMGSLQSSLPVFVSWKRKLIGHGILKATEKTQVGPPVHDGRTRIRLKSIPAHHIKCTNVFKSGELRAILGPLTKNRPHTYSHSLELHMMAQPPFKTLVKYTAWCECKCFCFLYDQTMSFFWQNGKKKKCIWQYGVHLYFLFF